MSVEMIQLASHEEWLKHRKDYIGGSDASCILGLNAWKSNLDLFREKTGKQEAPDLSGNEAVEYGTKAEEHIRALFALDHPELEVSYVPNNSWHNSKYPFAAASLDGTLTDESGRKGILEIKTAIITNKVQSEKWNNCIPDYYYCQLLHYFMVTEFDFAVLRARLRYEYPGNKFYTERDYYIERSECEEDIATLIEKEAAFYEQLKKKEEPPRILTL